MILDQLTWIWRGILMAIGVTVSLYIMMRAEEIYKDIRYPKCPHCGIRNCKAGKI